jgi:uncharacterized protein (DUF1697 family)
MVRTIAFLRAINVGGHTVTMPALRELFESIGLANVETFIASGNVIFETGSRSSAALQKKIEGHLHSALGYEVATFLRTDAELAAIARYQPFSAAALAAATTLNVAFLAEAAPAAAQKALLRYRSDIDDFHVEGREAYWLCQTKQSESSFFKVGMEKALGLKTTVRNINTVRRLAEAYPPASA